MSGSLHDALAQARQTRPEPLPSDFADGVMARLQKATPVRFELRPRDLATLAAVAVLVAAAISFVGESRQVAPAPPPLAMFQHSSLFADR